MLTQPTTTHENSLSGAPAQIIIHSFSSLWLGTWRRPGPISTILKIIPFEKIQREVKSICCGLLYGAPSEAGECGQPRARHPGQAQPLPPTWGMPLQGLSRKPHWLPHSAPAGELLGCMSVSTEQKTGLPCSASEGQAPRAIVQQQYQAPEVPGMAGAQS